MSRTSETRAAQEGGTVIGYAPPGRGPSLRRPAVAGLVGAAALTVAAAVLHTVWPAVPFIPEAIAQRLVRLTSGSINSFFIDRLGALAKRLGLLRTGARFLGVGLALRAAVG